MARRKSRCAGAAHPLWSRFKLQSLTFDLRWQQRWQRRRSGCGRKVNFHPAKSVAGTKQACTYLNVAVILGQRVIGVDGLSRGRPLLICRVDWAGKGGRLDT
jgi:hypothetical protein